jgi:hypothetical protein
VPGAVAEADGVVQRFAGQVDAVVVREQPQVDEGVVALEAAQPRHQPAHREGAHGGHGEHLAHAPALERIHRLWAWRPLAIVPPPSNNTQEILA